MEATDLAVDVAVAVTQDSVMVTKTSEVQRSERVGGASNNATQVVMSHKASAISISSIDDVRQRTFRGLESANRPHLWRILLDVVGCADPWKAPTEKRMQYHQWRREFQSFRISSQPEDSKSTEEQDQPSYLRDAALLKEIDKDVSRTRSELPFFSDGSIQQQWMLRILFVYAKLHPELGYMQGMNEILAPLLFVLGSDTNDAWASEAEPDAFFAFSAIMSSVKVLYSPSPTDPSKIGVDTQMSRLTVLLRQHDALLWQHLNSIGLSPDYYSFRWYMTLLAREFSMEMTLRIWDALLADPKRFSFLHYVNLALVRSQRTKLLHEGFSGALKTLQSLPTVDVDAVLEQAQHMREKDRLTDRRRSLVQVGPLTTLTSDSYAGELLADAMADVNAARDAPHIVLYFDVNKTVIMHDPVQGKGLEHILNDLLTERAFGRVDSDGASWTWNGKSVLNGPSSPEDPREVTYGSFLRAKYPMSSDPKQAKDNKRLRKIFRKDFTSPGNPGAAFAHEHAALLAKLQLPYHDRADAKVAAAGLDESPHHFIIPAFFQLIQFLNTQRMSFNLIFRTYGDDLHRIAQEFNLFCRGHHPFFSPGASLLDGSNGTIDRRLHLSSVLSAHRHGTFYRSNDTTALVMGTFLQPATVNEDHVEFYKNVPGVNMISGVDKIHTFLTTQWRETQATLALRDFYPHWFAHQEDPRAGKLMTVNTADTSTHVVFFDDNILANEPHIVDARTYPDGQALAWDDVRDVQLMRVEPLDAVRDQSYFISQLLSSLEKHRKQ